MTPSSLGRSAASGELLLQSTICLKAFELLDQPLSWNSRSTPPEEDEEEAAAADDAAAGYLLGGSGAAGGSGGGTSADVVLGGDGPGATRRFSNGASGGASDGALVGTSSSRRVGRNDMLQLSGPCSTSTFLGGCQVFEGVERS